MIILSGAETRPRGEATMTRAELLNYVADMLGHEEAAQRIVKRIVNQLGDNDLGDWTLIQRLMQEEIDA